MNTDSDTIPIIFNRKIVKIHRDRIADSFKNYDFLAKYYSQDIIDRLEFFSESFNPKVILEIGARNGILSESLRELYPESMIVCSDLSCKMLSLNPELVKLVIDEEQLPFEANSLDLVISNLTLHWVNDVPGVLFQIYNALKPGGIFIGNFFGGRSLEFLRRSLLKAESSINARVCPHVSPMIPAFAISDLMKRANFSSSVTDSHVSKIKYSSILELMRDLKYMGESSALISSEHYSLNNKIIEKLMQVVQGEFEEEFEIITVTGRKV